MRNMAQKLKPRLASRRFTIVGFSYLHGVSRHSGWYLDRVPTKVSVHKSTDYRLTDIWLTLNGSSLSVDNRSMFGCYTADISPTEHRHTTDVSSTLVLHVVDSSLDCCQFWMFWGFSLSKCCYSVKSQRDAKISFLSLDHQLVWCQILVFHFPTHATLQFLSKLTTLILIIVTVCSQIHRKVKRR